MRPTRLLLSDANPRRGIVSVWIIVSAPLLVTALGMALNVGFLWLARTELKNASASGALAAAQVWGEDPSRSQRSAVRAAQWFTSINEVSAASQSPAAHGPRVSRVLVGELKGATFFVGAVKNGSRACLVEAIAKVEGPFGWLTGPRTIRTTAVAVFDVKSGTARLAHVNRVVNQR